MQSLWSDQDAEPYAGDPLQMRVYSSRLLGQNPDLVLHGGGNTSVKAQATNLLGDTEEVLYIKGSGWDLATIEAAGFPAVKLDILQRLAELETLSDTDMVRMQKSAMLDPGAPSPSVEAILHAIIPFTWVDHTHADAVVTISNTRNGVQRIRELYGERVLIIPYVMPGFILAKKIREMTQVVNWPALEGIVLLNHGIFSFGDDAKSSYERMIKLVSQAEDYLHARGATLAQLTPKHTGHSTDNSINDREELLALADIRRLVSREAGCAMIAKIHNSDEAVHFSGLDAVTDRHTSCATRGPLTPDHVIRTKRSPVIIGDNAEQTIADYSSDYRAYFSDYATEQHKCLDTAPRWAVWPGHGLPCFGKSNHETNIIRDIVDHTIKAIQQGEQLGGWQALPASDIFDMEYWELEQAKLGKQTTVRALQGKVALVTGAASGIGRACVAELQAQGAAVIALDINENVSGLGQQSDTLALVCDITAPGMVREAIDAGVREFGGLDILVNNAGIFPASLTIEEMDAGVWRKSMAVNLDSHQMILTSSIPYLKLGVNPAVIFIASKNVAAPGPGASAYSVAKAGLTQLARVAALELAPEIRVNIIHPDAVFDTAIWTNEVLTKRAGHYGMSIDDYKTKNMLKVKITSKDVAQLACAMAGPLFFKTTGAQVSIDGGNDRVI